MATRSLPRVKPRQSGVPWVLPSMADKATRERIDCMLAATAEEMAKLYREIDEAHQAEMKQLALDIAAELFRLQGGGSNALYSTTEEKQ